MCAAARHRPRGGDRESYLTTVQWIARFRVVGHRVADTIAGGSSAHKYAVRLRAAHETNGWVAGILIALLGLEWILRRRYDLT